MLVYNLFFGVNHEEGNTMIGYIVNDDADLRLTAKLALFMYLAQAVEQKNNMSSDFKRFSPVYNLVAITIVLLIVIPIINSFTSGA